MSLYEFGPAEGYHERQPVLLLLDTSASMGRPAEQPPGRPAEQPPGRPAGQPPIDALNDALVRWFDGERTTPRLRARVEVCLVAFDSRVRVFDHGRNELVPVEEAASDRLFVPVDGMRPPRLEASGLTRLTDAVETALELARSRYRTLQEQHVPVRRPFLWVLTDGAPSDAHGNPMDPAALAGTARRVRLGEERGEFVLQAVGVRGADLELLQVLAPKAVLMLEDLSFGQILDLLFQSSDRITPDRTADDIHRDVRQYNEKRERMRRLEEKHR
ncbi:VWA domain-containing protein [Kitasatospora kazusensis]|uniref:VWA domain-containing protein n=1 Tax=Kitasatospora kazusensis TaxID=407974 RepID=A0ABP5KWP9_9ACTN